MDDCEIPKKRNGMINPIISGVVFLGITLIMGSYGYIWSEMKGEQDEKREWRKEHQQVLDKRFDKLEQGQDKIQESVNRNEIDNKVLLNEILIEQRKANEVNKLFVPTGKSSKNK